MPKDALHQLIHSLSPSEKGDYIRSKGESHLTTLFKTMNKLEVYDKAVLEKRLQKHPELLKHLHKYKNDTYSDLMRSMRSYKQEKDHRVETRLRVNLFDIGFLMERGLYENAMKLLQDAKKLGLKYERYDEVLKIIDFEITLSKRLYTKDYIEIIRTLVEEKGKLISILHVEYKYEKLRHLIVLSNEKNPYSSNEQRLQYLNEFIKDELLVNKDRAVSFYSQRVYHYIFALYYNLEGNLKEKYYHRKKVVECWDAHPHMKQENIRPYVASVYNYLISCVECKEYKTFEQQLDKMKNEVNPKNIHEKAMVFQRVYYSQLFYYYGIADFDKLDRLIAEMTPSLKKYAKFMEAKDVYTFKASIANILFIMDKKKECFNIYSEIIKKKLSIRINFLCDAWLCKLAIAYDLEDDNFDNLYRAAQRFFQKIEQEETEAAYTLFMEFIYRANRSTESESKALCKEYRSAIIKLKDGNARSNVSINKLLIWMEHLLTNESKVDLYKAHIAAREH